MVKKKKGIALEIKSFKSIRSSNDVGILIHTLRKEKNLTQAELAKLSGVKQQTISAIENRNQNAELKTLFSILSIFNLELVVRNRTQRIHGFAPGREGQE